MRLFFLAVAAWVIAFALCCIALDLQALRHDYERFHYETAEGEGHAGGRVKGSSNDARIEMYMMRPSSELPAPRDAGVER